MFRSGFKVAFKWLRGGFEMYWEIGFVVIGFLFVALGVFSLEGFLGDFKKLKLIKY